MKNVMTAPQALNFMISTHPSLYTSSSFLTTKMKCYDHIFNTIGNGHGDLASFKDSFKITLNNVNLTESFPPKYITSGDLYTAYTATKDLGHGIKMGVSEAVLDGLYTKEELSRLEGVEYYIVGNKKRNPVDFIPYPNFKKKYSFVWNVDINQLDESWVIAAKEFYENCLQFFKGEDRFHYHGAYPKDEKEIAKIVRHYKESLDRYNVSGLSVEEINQKISLDYGITYTGDLKAFISKGWDIDLDRILGFIDETIIMLSDNLEHRNSNSKNIKAKLNKIK